MAHILVTGKLDRELVLRALLDLCGKDTNYSEIFTDQSKK